MLVYQRLNHVWLVVPTPVKNMISSVGMMTFPIYGKYSKYSKPPTRCYINPRKNPRLVEAIQPTVPQGTPGPGWPSASVPTNLADFRRCASVEVNLFVG